MINVKITLNSGKNYLLKNGAENLQDFVKNTMMPYGTITTFWQIFPKEMILINQIETIIQLTDEELEVELKKGKEIEEVKGEGEIEEPVEDESVPKVQVKTEIPEEPIKE